MSIVFTNPRGKRVRVNPEQASVVETSDEGVTYSALDPETGEIMMETVPGGIMSETDEDDPMSMEQDYEDQIYNDQLNMIEDAAELDNPPKMLFTWKNLRLPSAIAGEKAALGATGKLVKAPSSILGRGKRFLLRELPANQSIRGSPFLLQLVTAEQWYDYISNMARNPVDMGAELSSQVSASEKLAVAMFVKEAEINPGFTNLLRKAVPGADPAEITAMGQMVYDLMTGRGPNPLAAKGYGTFKYDKMFRLAYDILQSMPINQYNSYTLFKLQQDEGSAAYSDITNSYTPLELSEVGLVLEIRDSLAQYGSGYANMVISEPSLAAEAAALMQRAVSAYANGDTVSVRSILTYLQDSPFYYKTLSAGAKNIFEAKDGSSKDNIVGVVLEKASSQGLGELLHNGHVYLKDPQNQLNVDKNTGRMQKDGNWKNKEFEVIKSPFDTTVAGVLKFQNSANKYTFIEGATMNTKRSGNEKKSAAAQLADAIEGRSNPRGKPTGRGKFYNLEVHTKGNLDMKLKATTSGGQGDLRHGAPPKGKDGSQDKWTFGLYKLLNADIEKMNAKHKRDTKSRKDKFSPVTVMISGGKHKKTGKWAPYRIKLPKSHFSTTRLPDGTQTVGLKSGKATPAIRKAWKQFTEEYGLFVRNDNKGTEFRFTPSKKAEHRGAYQDRFRRQVGGAKRSR